MRRRLNVRLLLMTVGAIALFAGMFHALHVWQVARNSSKLLHYAREAKTEGKIDQAISLYDQYLKQVPGDLDAQEELALTLDAGARSAHDRFRVVAMLEELLLRTPTARDRARERLIVNLAYLGRYDAAVRQLEILRATASDPAEIEHIRGWCLDAAGKAEPAAQAFANAVKHDPKRVQTWILLAEVLHHRLSKDVDALAALNAMVEANPDSAPALLARFRYYRLFGRETDAIKDLASARRIAPDDPDVILAACQWAQSKGEFAEARNLAAHGAKKYPANEAMIKELANLELRQGNRERALEVVEAGLKALKNKTTTGELQVFRADLLIDAGKLPEAAAIVADLRSQGLSPALPDFLEARILAHEKKWAEAEALLEKARLSLGSDPYWNSRINAQLGLCHGQLGDGERQIAAYLDAARSEPRWTALNLSIGQAYLDADNPDQALAYLEPLLDDADAPPATRLLIARARFRQMMARPERDRQWKTIDAAIKEAARANPGSLDLALLQSEILHARRETDAARAMLTAETTRRAADAKPDDLRAWTALAGLEALAGDFDRADKTLNAARKLFGDQVAIRLAQARVLLQRGRGDDREGLKALADNAGAFSPEDRGRLHRELAEMWLRHGELAAAKSLLENAVAERPRDLRGQSLLLDLALQSGRIDDARKTLQSMKAIDSPKGPQSTYGALLVRVEEAIAKPETLRSILTEMRDSPLRTGDGRLEVVEARVLERLGEKDRAIAKLIDAVNAGQRDPRMLHRLVQLLTERRQYDQLAWVLRLLEGRGPLPREMGRAAVDAAIATGAFDQARQLLGPFDLRSIRDYRELLWLAGVEKALDDVSLAEQSLRRALEVAPHAPDAWVALARFFVTHDARPLAEDLIVDIDRKAPEKSRPLIRARCLEAIGDLARAEAAFGKLVASRPNDFIALLAAADFFRHADLPDRARPLYEKVLDPTLATPTELAVRARRGLALTSSPEVGRALLAKPRNRADERAAMFLEGLDPAKRAEAIRRFEESLTQAPASAEETFQLARLQDADGRFKDAAARLDQLIAEDQATPQMLAWLAQALASHGQLDRARLIALRFLSLEPDSPRSRLVETVLSK